MNPYFSLAWTSLGYSLYEEGLKHPDDNYSDKDEKRKCYYKASYYYSVALNLEPNDVESKIGMFIILFRKYIKKIFF